jgi:DNA primase large subunit
LAKYPFTNEAAEHVKELDLKIEDMSGPILTRAEQRIEEALLKALVSTQLHNDEIEITSFPVAVMMVASTADTLMKRRYALSEAKRAYNLLNEESKDKILKIASAFNWKIRLADNRPPYEFALSFMDYLKNATRFQAKEWKLVNRVVVDGEVYLTKDDTARLLEEVVRAHIEKKLDVKGKFALPQNVAEQVERLKQTFIRQKGKIQFEEFPKGVVISAFPPCIKNMYDGIRSGHHLSHIGRFALTSFLINIGMTTENVINLYRSLSDFNERLTRYQVEHIAGGRGSRTRYIPPQCSTLRTHGVCTGMDEICKEIRHPLAYYRRKLRTIETKVPVERAQK